MRSNGPCGIGSYGIDPCNGCRQPGDSGNAGGDSEVVSFLDAYETPKAVERMKEWLQNVLKPEQRMLIESALAAIEKEYDEDKAIEILAGH